MRNGYQNKSVIGPRIRERREALGLAQEKIGVAIGLDESSARARISRYELGVHEPPYQTVKLLAGVLQVPLTYIYCEDGDVAELLLLLYSLSATDRAKKVQDLKKLILGN